MKKLLALFLISMALLFNLTSKAQSQLVIGTGGSTNDYVPVVGSSMNLAQRTQIIYHASEIPQTLVGGKITGMTFHSQNTTVSWETSIAVVRLMHTSASSLITGLENTSSATVVCKIAPLSISDNQLIFNFTTPFTYTGGNLLFEIETTRGIANNASFVGGNPSVSGNVCQQFMYNSPISTYSFMPKLTVEYIPSIPLERMYDYDVSGNRTCRRVLTIPGGGKSAHSTNTDVSEETTPEKEVVYTEKIGNIKLTVFPNPTTQTATIRIHNYTDFTEGSLFLYTPSGQLLQQYQINSSEFTIDLSNYVAGNYLLKLQMNQHSDTWKIIKQ